MWQPADGRRNDDDSWKQHLFKDGKGWPGLVVRISDTTGRGFIASQQFPTGSVICDYHGKVFSGHKNMWQAQDDTSYLFCFNVGGKSMYIDASGYKEEIEEVNRHLVEFCEQESKIIVG